MRGFKRTAKKIHKMLEKLDDKVERIIDYVQDIDVDDSDWSAEQFYVNQKQNALRELLELRSKLDDIYNMTDREEE